MYFRRILPKKLKVNTLNTTALLAFAAVGPAGHVAIDRYRTPAGPTTAAANPPRRRAAAEWWDRQIYRRTDARLHDTSSHASEVQIDTSFFLQSCHVEQVITWEVLPWAGFKATRALWSACEKNSTQTICTRWGELSWIKRNDGGDCELWLSPASTTSATPSPAASPTT